MGGSADRWVWLAFLLVLLLSGLIAYLGDLIGRRIGRKRLTIFGLRPKRTAILFTVMTGMLISGLAMALLLFASEGARKRILSYNTTVSSLQARIDEQADRREEAQQRAAAARLEVERTERELNQSEVALKTATAARLAAQQELTGARQLTTEATRRAAETQRRVVDAQRRLREAQRLRLTAQQRLQTALAEVARAERDEAESRRRLDENLRDLRVVNAQLATAQSELTRGESLIAEQFKTLDARRKQAEEQLQLAQRELLDARIARDQILGDLRRVQNRSDELLEGELVVRFREELGRSLFRYQSGALQIEQQLESFMRAVDREARERGAAPDLESGERAAVLPGETDAARDVYRLNVLDFLTDMTRQRPVWLRAISTRNAVRGQAVAYQLWAVPDTIVFEAGQLLGSVTLDGREAEASLARQLETLIRDQVNVAARTATDQRPALLPNLDGSYTRVGPEKWLPVLREIQQHDGLVTVEVVAASVIRVGDELEVDFRVRGDAES